MSEHMSQKEYLKARYELLKAERRCVVCTVPLPDDSKKPIVFAEWSDTGGGMFKRRDYTMANLLVSQPLDGPNLFSDLGDQAFIPTPVADYPRTHFLKLGADENPEL